MAKRKRENGTTTAKVAKQKNGDTASGKKLIINAFVMMCKYTLPHRRESLAKRLLLSNHDR